MLDFHESREEVVADPKLAEWPNCMLKLIFSRRIRRSQAYLDVLETYRQYGPEGVLAQGYHDILAEPPNRYFPIGQCIPNVRFSDVYKQFAIWKGSGS